VWIESFPRHSPNRRVELWEFSLAKSENSWPKNIERISERGKTLARLASGIVFLIANPEF
jgi:hypothetical protein